MKLSIARVKQQPQVNVQEVGHALAGALRSIYHYPCQHRDPTLRIAALLSVYLYIDKLSDEMHHDFLEACDDEDFDAQKVLERLPQPLADAVATMIDDICTHGPQPQEAFIFNQKGFGQA